MNINREFSANANRPSAREVELFFDIEENSLAYIDHNRIKRLVPGEGRNAPSSTILCRLDLSTINGVNPDMLIIENPLPQDFKFKISAGDNPGEYKIKNANNVSGFSDPEKTRIIVDPVVQEVGGVATLYPTKVWTYFDREFEVTSLHIKVGNRLDVPRPANFITWLEITVYNIEGRKLQKAQR